MKNGGIGILVLGILVLGQPGLRPAQASSVSIPMPDRIVVVIEENHSYQQIIGDVRNAPFLNLLAREGALFTRSYGVRHPSQPNYLALFSGSTQGSTGDECPAPGSPFATPNLADELEDKGYTFSGYSEDLPYAGFTGCETKMYARKHVPWTNWLRTRKLNLPFASFPSDYGRLPTVSFVIPNLANDMHSAPVAIGDKWLKKNFSGYIRWAETHNSLFIVTFDEDNNTPLNRIPTIFVGPMVKIGKFAEKINHFDVFRTLEAMYKLPRGESAGLRPIHHVWKR